jgi:hypothetical protein
MQAAFTELMNTLVSNAELSIDTTTLEGVEIHMLYIVTACSLIKDTKSPARSKFESRITSMLMANQNKVYDVSDTRWELLFDCWIYILDSIGTIPEVPRNSVLKLINSGL